jgi:hypothetical protein
MMQELLLLSVLDNSCNTQGLLPWLGLVLLHSNSVTTTPS